jgi:hypothetical protein
LISDQSDFNRVAMKRWFSGPDDSWRERAMGAILAVTFVGVTVIWVGASVLLVEKLVF